MKSFSILAALLAIAIAAQPLGSTEIADTDPEWPDDEDWTTAGVNEGELEFLAEPPAERVHHHHNQLTLRRGSRADGWVRMEQCHSHIDRVPRAQILFRAGRVRNLRITASENIGRAWVEDASVQLQDIGEGSRLCLDAESFALSAGADGSYRLGNGPFMRRFLDGYYPMRVSQKILLADSGLVFSAIEPRVQPGFEVRVTAESIVFDAWFEGRLLTEIRLVPEN